MKHNIILFAFLAALTAGAIAYFNAGAEAQADTAYRPVTATITSFGSGAQMGGLPPAIYVYAQSEDGAIGVGQFAPELVKGCVVGDTIAAEAKNGTMRLLPRPCDAH